MKLFDWGGLAMFLVGAGLSSFIWWANVVRPIQPVQPQPSYLVRRVEMKIVDTRKNPDKSINPSWMEPNMRFTCIEEIKP